ncbi:elongation of very long chain fatty acids protein AAEL008004 [Odontomachus brunneus]|uniref:elongation of very long chain fatty acids protein AAEL008004 n=1 Tax=Odontomachus brunneus TaxID=486640 RepID=UPI0013F204D3|nr:elongation of very long chain fatty acids protein AAEL008004 [Odontomachus brunneus]XP_032672913.1 elongation of very long chain fatty acids protein AAEL008004 [Odontomachus brunneus]
MNASASLTADRMSNIYNNSVVRFYHHVFHDLSDPRTREWVFISSPVPAASILIGYLYFVLSWGPRHMEHRKPYQLKNVLVLYNFLQVLISIWLFLEGLDGAWLKDYNWKCQPVDFSYSPDALRVARGVYIYFLAKLTELLDTVFFVLRKKERQITFLHMYHHTVMPMASWGATKYYPGGHGIFIGIINSFVHIIMYSYYLLAALLPQYQQYLWWKKYITTLQMGQFCLAFLHNIQLLFYDCEYPRWSMILILPNAMFFYFLFADFYNNAYTTKKENGVSPTQNSAKASDVAEKVSNNEIPNGKGKSD